MVAGRFGPKRGVRTVLANDENVQRHRAEVERLLRVVCEDDEVPWFVSDEATVFDVSTASEVDLMQRIATAFGESVTAHDLRLPLWRLATRLRP